MGSFKGASASGYLALPMTRANRSAAVAADREIGAIDKVKMAINVRRILIRRQSSQKGADSSPAPRRPYPTEIALSNRARKRVNCLRKPRKRDDSPRRACARRPVTASRQGRRGLSDRGLLGHGGGGGVLGGGGGG